MSGRTHRVVVVRTSPRDLSRDVGRGGSRGVGAWLIRAAAGVALGAGACVALLSEAGRQNAVASVLAEVADDPPECTEHEQDVPIVLDVDGDASCDMTQVVVPPGVELPEDDGVVDPEDDLPLPLGRIVDMPTDLDDAYRWIRGYPSSDLACSCMVSTHLYAGCAAGWKG